MKPAGPRSLKGRALQWLAQREHSRIELQRKLMPHAEAEDEAAAAQRDRADVLDRADLLDRVGAADGTHRVQGDQGSGRLPAEARVEALLDWLEAQRYLSAQRFAESRIHARASRFGNLRIRQELAQHGVPLSDEARAALQGSELERARAVWSRKFKRAEGAAISPEDRGKQARFLTARGFSSDVVRQVLRDAAASEARAAATPDDAPD